MNGRRDPRREPPRRDAAPTPRARPLMPRDVWEITGGTGRISHPYLLWNRFPPAFRDPDGKRLGRDGPAKLRKLRKQEQDAWSHELDRLVKGMNGLRPGLLEELDRRTRAAARALREGRGMKVLHCEASQTEPLVSGQGEHHALEAGFMFHPMLGVPFLKGSGIKGALRHRILMRLAEEAGLEGVEDKALREAPLSIRKTLRRLFGTALKDPRQESASRKEDEGEDRERAGGVWVLDAFPLPGSANLVDLDVLTPHHDDFQDPVPVVYLVVPPETKWRFCVGLDPEVQDDAELVKQAFLETLEIQGLGGKTSSAHGRFLVLTHSWLGENGFGGASAASPGGGAPPLEVLPPEVQGVLEDAGRVRNLGEAKSLLNRMESKHSKYLQAAAARLVEALRSADPSAARKLAEHCRNRYKLEGLWKD